LATVSRSGVFIERAGLKLLDPGPVQVARNVVAFRETAERHARNEFLGDLPFVFDAMGTVPGYGFWLPSSESPAINFKPARCPP
jgi:hypothetical protein